jgi:chromosomal replication initiator protein
VCLDEGELQGPVLYRSAETLQTLARREGTQRELTSVLARLAERNTPVIVGADRPLTTSSAVGKALGPALRGAHSVALRKPEWETRVAIFLDRARDWGVHLGTNIAAALASGIGEDLHRLDIVMTRAMLLRRSEEEPLDLEHARRTLAPGALYGRPPSPEVILDVVARRFGLRVREIRARDRNASRSMARQVAAYLLRTRCGLSFPEIGRKLDRHYTTVLNAVQRSEARLGEDASFASLLGLIEKEVILRTERGK